MRRIHAIGTMGLTLLLCWTLLPGARASAQSSTPVAAPAAPGASTAALRPTTTPGNEALWTIRADSRQVHPVARPAFSNGQKVGITLTSAIGSVGGAYGGALIGLAANDGEFDGGAAVSMAAGSVLGSMLGAGAVSGEWTKSLIGSALGSLAGFAVLRLGEGGSSAPPTAIYPVIHSVLTMLTATS